MFRLCSKSMWACVRTRKGFGHLRRDLVAGSGRRAATLSALMVVVVGVASLLGGCGKESTASKANGLIQSGIAAAKAGDLTTAIADYQGATTANPLSAIAYYDLGVAYGEKGEVVQSRTSFQKALLIQPGYKSALYDLAVLDTPTEPATAVSLYQQLIGIDANSPNALLNLGLLLEHLGQHTAGAADVAKAIVLDPSLRSGVSTPTTKPTKPTPPTTAPTTPTTAAH